MKAVLKELKEIKKELWNICDMHIRTNDNSLRNSILDLIYKITEKSVRLEALEEILDEDEINDKNCHDKYREILIALNSNEVEEAKEICKTEMKKIETLENNKRELDNLPK